MFGHAQLVTCCLLVPLLLQFQGVRSVVISADDEAAIEAMLDHVMDCREIPGLTMTLVKGKEYKTISRGVADLATGEPVTSRTLFHVGTLTQSFTSTLLAIVKQRSGNQVQADQPIAALLAPGELEFSNPELVRQITLRDALLHRTGLTTGSIGSLTGLPQAMSRADLIKNLKELPQQSGLREGFNFNKFTFTLAAYAAEKLMSSTWEKLMRSHLLDRLLMTSTLVDSDDTSGPEFARSYVSEEGKLVEGDRRLLNLGPLAPAGTMWTTSEDMNKALRLFLGDAMLFSQIQLPGGAMEEMMMPHILLGPAYRSALDRSGAAWPVPDFNVGYGMGFFRNVYRGYQVPWQVSVDHGFGTIMWLIPEKNTGLFISLNGQKHSEMPMATLQALTYYVTDILLGEEPWLNASSICSFPAPFAEAVEFPDMKFETRSADFVLSDYIGRFNSPLLGDLFVRKHPTMINALRFAMADIEGKMLPEGGNVFRLFLEGRHRYMAAPRAGRENIPFARLFFEFAGPECVGVKVPDTIFGGAPVDFKRVADLKEEL